MNPATTPTPTSAPADLTPTTVDEPAETYTPRLAGCKKGDFLAYVTHGGWSSHSTSVKVPVIKVNKRTVVFEHNGVQQKVGMDGHLYMNHVEPWDDAKEAKRAHDAAVFAASKAYQIEDMPVRLLPGGGMSPSPEDIVANPELWAEITAIRERAQAETAQVCEKMRRLRICREAAAGVNTHYGPGAVVHDGPIDGCLDCAHLECRT